MAATIYSSNPVVIENVSILPKSAAKIAAGFLILTSIQYNPATDVARAKQAKFFEEPASFVSTQKPSNLVVLLGHPPTYNPGTDVRRASQAKVFSDPEAFVKTQYSNPLVLAAFVTTAQNFLSRNYVSVENVSIIKTQKGSLVVLSQPQVIPQSSDAFIGQDTTGWPKETFEPETFIKAMLGYRLVTDTFTAYNPGADVRRAIQAKFFADPEVFIPPTHINYVVTNNFAYNPASDVTRLKHQALYFQDPEVFVKTKAPFPVTLNFTPYVPGTDVRRSRQALVFQDVEVFPRAAPFNPVIVNGLVQISPLEFAHGLDIYDGLNGTIKLAWGQFTPTPQSMNIYVNGVLNQSVPFSALQATITGLVIASYNPSTQIVTPSQTYHISVVAVINGLERGQIDKTITVSPTSVMLVTPMKRLWPFPNTGLD